jgi:N-acetylglucosamine malate deacetylase 1
MTDNGHILAIMCHPDDIEILCAGTLLRLRDAGYTLHIATITGGDGGSMELDNQAITRVRLAEAQAAADLLGATYHCAGGEDFLVRYEPTLIRSVVEIIRATTPFLVLTHYPHDYMIDHEETSRIVRMACFAAGAPNMRTRAFPAREPAPGVPYLYYAQPIDGTDIFGEAPRYSTVVDVSAQAAGKEALLKCHASQRAWLMAHHGMDEYVDALHRMGAKQGEPYGVAHAESFRQHLGHPYPHDDWLGAKLGNLLNG